MQTSFMVNAKRRAAPRPEAGYMSVQRCGLVSASIIPPVKPRRKREDLLAGVSLKRIQKTSVYYAVSPTGGLESGFGVSFSSCFLLDCVYVRHTKGSWSSILSKV